MVNLNYNSVHHPIPTLPVGIGNTLYQQFSKQISKLSFQVSAQVYSLLAQTEGERKVFFEGRKKKGEHIMRLPPEYLAVTRDEKVSPFVKFEVILPLLCFLLDPLTNKHFMTWNFMKDLCIDSKSSQK